MGHIACRLANRQRLTARAWQCCVMENLLPITRSVRSTAMQLVLHQLPGVRIVLIVGHRVVEAGLENRFQLAVLHVARNANADFAQEHNDQENGELYKEAKQVYK